MIRTRITLELELPSVKEAHEFAHRLHAGEVSALWWKTFQVVGVTHIVEPDLPEEK